MDFTMQSAKSRLCSAVKNFLEKIVEGKRPSVDADDSLPFCREKDGNALCFFGHNDWKFECGGDWQFVEDAWVAVCEECVSVDGEYEMILHPDMLNNEKGKEKS